MFIPLGFQKQSIATSVGRIAYYTPLEAFWKSKTENPKNLVFIHGFGGGSSAYEWSKVYPAFAVNYRVFAPDLLGWGRSEHPEREYTIDDYLTNITEFIEKTCTVPVTVVASSLTAALVVRAAIARPELFESLILTNPSGLSDFGDDYSQNFFAQIIRTPILDRVVYSTAIATTQGISSFLEQRQFAQPNRIYPEIIEAYLASATQTNAEYAALSFVRGDLCFDLSLYIPQLTTPTAILWGEKTQFTSPATGKRLADLNPTAVRSFQILEDVGLTPQLELPAVTIGIIEQCIQSLSS
ncbi:MAG: alpha/beta hydrolase [Cyanobacteriota bacterium]|nr:alpha/beta hydrolase [Cyanobacteriota bacterium]